MNRVSRTKYLRFVILEKHLESHHDKGVFSAAYDLIESGELTKGEAQQVRDVLAWFVKNLHSPENAHIKDNCIFWFKDSAAEVIGKMWELVNVLRAHGQPVDVLTTEWPGRIVYADDAQVAAVGSKKTRLRRK